MLLTHTDKEKLPKKRNNLQCGLPNKRQQHNCVRARAKETKNGDISMGRFDYMEINLRFINPKYD